MYAKRKDVNHNQIEEVFRRLLADHVTDSSGWAGGAGDLFVSCGFFSIFVEVKRDSKAAYTAAQVRFQRTHPYSVWRCENIEEAEQQCKKIRSIATLLGSQK